MAMQKYTKGEGKVQVLFEGAEAQVIQEHRVKTGKASVSEFTNDELKALEADLDNARKNNA